VKSKFDSRLEKAHLASSNHEAEIAASEWCGCFYCRRIFRPVEIREWIEEFGGGKTALCPKCGIDAVLGCASGFPISPEFLSDMKYYWFK
jgi:hypothetical protein